MENYEKDLKEYSITVQVKAINLVKAKVCLKEMLNGLDKKSIWYSNKYDIKEIKIFKSLNMNQKLENTESIIENINLMKGAISFGNSSVVNNCIERIIKNINEIKSGVYKK